MSETWAIILAAGESKRMGFPKMLLNFNGKTMLERVIENVKSSDVGQILVVLGEANNQLSDLMTKTDVKYCYNNNYKQGMLSSVKCGISNLPEDCEAVLVFQGDQPFIAPEVTNSIIKAYKSSGKEIVIPHYKNKRGHPLLIGKKYLSKIESLNDDEGLRSLSYLYSEDVLEVETNDPAILQDFDTYEEYKRTINQIS